MMLTCKTNLLKNSLATLFMFGSIALVAQVDYESVADGPWDTPATWDPAGVPDEFDNAYIVHDVTSSGRIKINDVYIDDGGALSITGGTTSKVYGEFYIESGGTFTQLKNVDAYADYFNFGEHTGTADIRFRDPGSIEGTGIVSGSIDFQVRSGDRTIEEGTILSLPGDFRIYGTSTVTNSGHLTVDVLDASGTTANFVNADLGSIQIDGSVDADLIVTASAQDNTFIYDTNSGVSRKIASPVDGVYWNLTIKGSETTTERRIGEPISILGNLEIDNARFFLRDSGIDATVDIEGNVTILNGGDFDAAQSTFTFNNSLVSQVQTISSASEVVFHNVNLSTNVEVSVNQNIEVMGNLANDGTLNLNSGGNFDLKLGGNLTAALSWNLDQNKVTLNGVSAQTITGDLTIKDLDIDNFNGIEILSGVNAQGMESGIELTGFMEILSGNFVTNDRLTLRSDENGTANLGPIASGFSVSGSVKYQRYMNRTAQGWTQLCYPIEAQTWTDIDDDITTSGLPDSEFPDYEFINIRTYNETVSGGLNEGFEGISAVADAIDPLKGYFVFLPGETITADCAGIVKQQDQTFSLSYSPLSGSGSDGWNLIANPYPCTLDWDSPTGWNKFGLDGSIYVYDATVNAMATYGNGVGVNGGTEFIPSGQAFWVVTDQANPTLTVNEAAKVNQQATFRSDDEVPSHFKLKISNNTTQDEIAIITQTGASQEYEEGLDAFKAPTPEGLPALGLASISEEGYELSINTIGDITGNEIIPVMIEVPGAGTYQFEASNTSAFSASCFFLYDNSTEQTYSLIGDNQFEITFGAEELMNENRFAIHFVPGAVGDAEAPICYNGNDGSAIVDVAGDGPFTFQWTNEQGEMIYNHTSDFGSSSYNGLASGTYMVNIIAENAACTSQQVMIDIDYPEVINATTNAATPSCFGFDNGSIAVEMQGGATPFIVESVNGEPTTDLENLTSGEYNIVITDANGCSVETSTTIADGPQVVAEFTALNNTLANQMEVTFLPAADAESYNWEFGDGGSSNALYPVHYYPLNDIFDVTLTATIGDCSISTTQTVNTIVDAISEIASSKISIYRTNDSVVLIKLADGAQAGTEINVHNVLGQQVLETTVPQSGTNEIELDLPVGQPLVISIVVDGQVMKVQKMI